MRTRGGDNTNRRMKRVKPLDPPQFESCPLD